MEKDNLKIEFRAVPYAHEEKVLEYRISPEQDLTYYVEVSYLWGLITSDNMMGIIAYITLRINL